MKRIILLLILARYVCELHSQGLSSRLFSKPIKDFSYTAMIGKVNGNYYAVRGISGSGSASDKLIVFRFDSAFVQSAEEEFGEIVLKNGNYNFHSYILLQSRLYFFYQMQKKGVRYLAAAEVDLETLKLKGTYENILECSKTYDGVYIGGYFPDEFLITASANGKFFVVSYKENFETKFVCCDEELKVLWKTSYKPWGAEYDKIMTGTIKDIRVHDDGRVFILFKCGVVNNGSVNMAMAQFWNFLEIKKGEIMPVTLDSEGYELRRARIGFTPGGKAFVAGYYNYFKGNYVEIWNIGTFYFSTSLNSGAILFHPFTKEFLIEGKSESTKRQVEKNFQKHECAGAEGIFNIELLTGENGASYLVGEEVLDNSLPVALGLTHTTMSGYGTTSVTVVVANNERLSYENLIVTRFDTMGNMIYNAWIPKRQADNAYASYKAIENNDSLYIFYNENKENLLKVPAADAEIKRSGMLSDNIPVLIVISPNGSKKTTAPFGKENYMNINFYAAYSDKDKIIFSARRLNVYCFGSIQKEQAH